MEGNEMDIRYLKIILKGMKERTEKQFNAHRGKRGRHSPAANFELGATSVIDKIIIAIEKDSTLELEEWYKETV
jgi:hypothetical protein